MISWRSWSFLGCPPAIITTRIILGLFMFFRGGSQIIPTTTTSSCKPLAILGGGGTIQLMSDMTMSSCLPVSKTATKTQRNNLGTSRTWPVKLYTSPKGKNKNESPKFLLYIACLGCLFFLWGAKLVNSSKSGCTLAESTNPGTPMNSFWIQASTYDFTPPY